MVSDIELVESVPIIFDDANCLLWLFIEELLEILFCGCCDLARPHDVTDQVKEITETKTIEFDVIIGIYICQILLVIHQIMDSMFAFASSQKVGDLLGWIELCPIFIGDP